MVNELLQNIKRAPSSNKISKSIERLMNMDPGDPPIYRIDARTELL